MQAGKLRHRIQIQSYTSAADATGQMINSFSALTTVWGRVSPKSGDETTNEGTSQVHRMYEVTIRYTGDINSTYKLIHKTRTLNIKSVVDIDDRNREIKLICTEDIT